jgi:hypothetical protein
MSTTGARDRRPAGHGQVGTFGVVGEHLTAHPITFDPDRFGERQRVLADQHPGQPDLARRRLGDVEVVAGQFAVRVERPVLIQQRHERLQFAAPHRERPILRVGDQQLLHVGDLIDHPRVRDLDERPGVIERDRTRRQGVTRQTEAVPDLDADLDPGLHRPLISPRLVRHPRRRLRPEPITHPGRLELTQQADLDGIERSPERCEVANHTGQLVGADRRHIDVGHLPAKLNDAFDLEHAYEHNWRITKINSPFPYCSDISRVARGTEAMPSPETGSTQFKSAEHPTHLRSDRPSGRREC